MGLWNRPKMAFWYLRYRYRAFSRPHVHPHNSASFYPITTKFAQHVHQAIISGGFSHFSEIRNGKSKNGKKHFATFSNQCNSHKKLDDIRSPPLLLKFPSNHYQICSARSSRNTLGRFFSFYQNSKWKLKKWQKTLSHFFKLIPSHWKFIRCPFTPNTTKVFMRPPPNLLSKFTTRYLRAVCLIFSKFKMESPKMAKILSHFFELIHSHWKFIRCALTPNNTAVFMRLPPNLLSRFTTRYLRAFFSFFRNWKWKAQKWLEYLATFSN